MAPNLDNPITYHGVVFQCTPYFIPLLLPIKKMINCHKNDYDFRFSWWQMCDIYLHWWTDWTVIFLERFTEDGSFIGQYGEGGQRVRKSGPAPSSSGAIATYV